MHVRPYIFALARALTLKSLSARSDKERYFKEICGSDPSELNRRYLEETLRFARNNCAYYRERIPADLDLAQIPLLNKALIRKHLNELENSGAARKGVYDNQSGGSTGAPLYFKQDSEYADWGLACENFFYRNFLGLPYETTPKIVLWGSRRDLKNEELLSVRFARWASYTTFLNAYRPSNEQLHAYVRIINDSRPRLIKGYAGAVFQLASFIQRNGLKVHAPQALYVSAETVTAHKRKLIEQVFQAKLYDFYGSREVGPMAGECPHGRRHLFIFNNHIEVLKFDSDAPAAPGEKGRIVVTGLHNRTMPLIRYEIGDAGSITHESCPCGSALPLLAALDGRITEYLERPDGTVMYSEYVAESFFEQRWISEYQVTQHDYGRFEVLVEPIDRQPSADELAKLRASLLNNLGECRELVLEVVQQIPLSPQGKRMHTRNLIPEEKRRR